MPLLKNQKKIQYTSESTGNVQLECKIEKDFSRQNEVVVVYLNLVDT